VHAAIKNVDKGLFPKAFCKIIPDMLSGDPDGCLVMHADGAGTKSSLAYAYWRETGDIDVWRGVAQDAIVMNTDDLLCVGAVGEGGGVGSGGSILLSSTIGRNKRLIPGEVVAAIINGTEEFLTSMRAMGVDIVSTGGETADVGDLVRTVIVDSTVTARLRRADVIDNARIRPGAVIVGLASFGQAPWERSYNGGMGSNGLTSARHDVFAHYLAAKYPETYDDATPSELVYSGTMRLTDPVDVGALEKEGYVADRQPAGARPLDAGRLVLSPTRTYAPVVARVLRELPREAIHGMVHCSGGGQTKILHFVDNMHVVKDNLFPTPLLFRMIAGQSGTPAREMYKVFNMGHRMEFYVDERAAADIIAISKALGVDARVVGRVENAAHGAAGPGAQVTIRHEGNEFIYNKL
jgi:phosphoribosylformylglycinamidine cyclo-ligase